MRTFLIATTILAAAFSFAWAHQPASSTAAPPSVTLPVPPAPVVYYFQHPTRGHSGGLICAVWDDGVVLSATNWQKPGENLELSTLNGKAADLITQLKADGLLTAETTSHVVPDSMYLSIGGVLEDKRARSDWDEHIQPGWGANNKADDAYRTFAVAWIKTKITLASLRITGRRALTSKDTPEGHFRGYFPDHPSIPWRGPEKTTK